MTEWIPAQNAFYEELKKPKKSYSLLQLNPAIADVKGPTIFFLF